MKEDFKKLHFVGIGGVGMGSFAVALAAAGFEITGSDHALYEPMKGVLSRARIQLMEGFSPETPGKVSPDCVVIGNVVRRDNPEVMAWLQTDTPFVSFPEAMRALLIQDKKSIVCAGTHGKTTTTSWISFLLQELGMKPSYFVGGVPRDLTQGCLLTDGDLFVGEGDEYDSAFFDKGPKFLHYNPNTLILSNIEFDHADIYRDLAHVKASFEKLVSLLPGDGLLIARHDDPVVMEVTPLALCRVQTFGNSPAALWRLGKVEEDEQGFRFELVYKNRAAGTFRTPLFGEHNLMNLISGIACAVNLGAPMEKIRPIVERFHGARRRQEILLDRPIRVIDDFAHHPTEVAATLKAVRRRFPQGRLWALFEPRSATARRSVHQDDYAHAFDSADQVLIASPYRASELSESERFSTDTLVKQLQTGGKPAESFAATSDLVTRVTSGCQAGDIVVVMSNGEFDKIQEKLVHALA